MSHDATNWAIKQRGLKPAAKIVLWHLCDRFHPDNGCFPSQDTLAADCEMSRSSVNEHLAVLEDARLIRREQRRDGPTNRQKSTRYRFAFEPDFEACKAMENGQSPSPESGHGAVSGNCPEPCPENGQSRVQNPDTNPVREPLTEPGERERGRDPSIGTEGRQEAASKDVQKSVERAFEKAFRDWPSSIGDSRPAALKAWLALSPAERETGAAEAARYLDAVRAVGRKIPCAFGVYLAEKRWEGLPAKQEEPAQPVPAPPFGPVWSAVRMKMLLQPPHPSPAPASRFIADLVAQNDAAGRAERLKRQAIYGWPGVNALHEGALNRRGISVVAGSPAERLAALMEPVPVDSPIFEAWKAEHERRGWPWLPDPGAMPVVYLPAGGPEGLEGFEAALRGNNHDGAGQEAAE